MYSDDIFAFFIFFRHLLNTCVIKQTLCVIAIKQNYIRNTNVFVQDCRYRFLNNGVGVWGIRILSA